jgi:hypothetical protein
MPAMTGTTEWTWSQSDWMFVSDDITGEVYWLNTKTGERRPYDPEWDS